MKCDLECEGVSKAFGTLLAVDNVSLGIPGGSFFSILGPSGCGKTTLMRMIAGFAEPTKGDIRIKGRSVVADPPNRRNAKMVFQHLALFPMMNVAENIAFGLRCRGMGRSEIEKRVKMVLERIGLPDAGPKEVAQLSGGQKQRIAIARCMVLEPDVLLLDEPLGALDLKLRERMKIELKLLQQQFNTTFLYITHDQSEALVMSNHVAVMNHGRFEQIGTPQELYLEPRTAFVASFVGDSNRWDARVAQADGGYVRFETDAGLSFIGAVQGAGPLVRGDRVTAFVRPESIAIIKDADATAPANGSNRQDGVVDSMLFNGANSRVLVRVAGALLEVDMPKADRAPDFPPGDVVALSWSADHTMCFAQA